MKVDKYVCQCYFPFLLLNADVIPGATVPSFNYEGKIKGPGDIGLIFELLNHF
jgi:hypothetical protein